MRSKAAILTAINEPLAIDEVEIPALGVGQVLVKVYRSGICGAQIGEIAGAKGPDKYLPHLLGHEGSGFVVEAGPGVKYVKKDDAVVMHWRKGRGIEAEPPKYKWGNKVVGGGWVTTFNEYAVVSENRLTAIADDIPLEIAALMGCAVTTAFGLVNNEAHLKIGQSIAVAGCGGVGLAIIMAARMVGAHSIFAIDQYQHKVIKAAELGAAYSCTNIDDVRLMMEQGVDVFVDCTGAVDVIEKGYELTAAGGRMILVGQPPFDHSLLLRSFAQHYNGKVLLDSQGGRTDPSTDIPRYLNLWRAGRLDLDALITHRMPLEHINEALELSAGGDAGRIMVGMG